MSHRLFSEPRSRGMDFGALPNGALITKRASGTNGWMSSWGTNAHGEIAGCPPPRVQACR